MNMYNQNIRRGSALLMVIGLLTILVMLGVTFMVIARLNADQSEAAATRAQADPIADGIVSMLVQKLKEDLYIGDGANQPYSDETAMTADAEGWKKYTDYASDDIDDWLSHHDEDSPQNDYASLLLTSDTSANKVDIDGDDMEDTVDVESYIHLTGVTDRYGRQYRAAVQVTDLSGLMCVNTAGEGYDADTDTDATFPVRVDLKGFLGETHYNYIHTHGRTGGSGKKYDGRCGTVTPTNLTDYFNACSGRLYSPADGYRPFGIADEPFLRWLKQNSSAKSGRLYELLEDSSIDRRYLTTFSCSRSLVRRPNSNIKKKLILHDPDDDQHKINIVAHRQDVYEQMLHMLTELNLSGDKSKMAAHFVANLWAYVSAGDADQPWAFSPQGSTFTVYGLKQDLVITEAFAKHKANTLGQSGDDHAWGYAIELMNPSDESIDIDSYSIIGGGNLPDKVSVPTNGKVVVYSFGKGDDYNGEASDFFSADVSKWIENAAVDFSGNDTVEVMLVRNSSVPADQVTNDDLGYSCPDKDFPSADVSADARRDDVAQRARYNLAVYKKYNSHALGKANGLSANDIDHWPVPIVRAKSLQQDTIEDLGECGMIYLTGPSSSNDGNNLEVFSKNIIDSDISNIFADNPARGRLNFYPYNISYGGYSASAYPDVPAACMLGEFFGLVPTDETRVDEKIPTRTYGKININTAPKKVLEQLPFDTNITISGLNPPNIDVTSVVDDAIINYREATQRNIYNISNLRVKSQYKGFLTPGEVAVPLANYVENKIQKANPDISFEDLKKHKGFLLARDSLYRDISNVITVNSDTFAANIRVDLYDDETGLPRYRWNYVAVIDRSCCFTAADDPAVLLFTPVK